jgi:hypothetical protein
VAFAAAVDYRRFGLELLSERGVIRGTTIGELSNGWHHVIISDDVASAKVLLALGIPFSGPDIDRFGMACNYDRLAICRLLLGAGADPHGGMRGTMERESPELLELLLSNGVDPNKGGVCGIMSYLDSAVSQSSEAMVRILIAYGADLNSYGVLRLAVTARNIDIIRLLLEAGADPNWREGNGGETALCHAVRLRCGDAVGLLLEYGADVNILTTRWDVMLSAGRRGETGAATVLDIARHELRFSEAAGVRAIERMLLEHGAVSGFVSPPSDQIAASTDAMPPPAE